MSIAGQVYFVQCVVMITYIHEDIITLIIIQSDHVITFKPTDKNI